jgi:hypothetical protein
MTPTQKLNQTIFTMSSIYGALTNQELWDTLQKDLDCLKDIDLSRDYFLIAGLIDQLRKTLKEIILIEKQTIDLNQFPFAKELNKICLSAKSQSLGLARKASKFLTTINKQCPRLIYKSQLWCLSFVFDKHDQFI